VPGGHDEDVVQEVFLTVLNGIKAFTKDGMPAAFRRWLYAITRYKVLEYWADPDNRLRNHEIDKLLAPPPSPYDSDEIDPRPVTKEELRRVRDEIRHDWNAFWKCAVEERSANDVAKELDISPCAVEKAVSNVLKCLREEDEDGVPGRVLLLHGLLELIRNHFEDRTFRAFWRVAVDGCPAEEVAEELGIKNVGTVHTAKARVLKRLREEFKALGFHSSDGNAVIADVSVVAQQEVAS
jgi:DNA-directed RNA polymerase specialized sigma24 family protein